MLSVLLLLFVSNAFSSQPSDGSSVRSLECCEVDGGPVLEEDVKTKALEISQQVSSNKIVRGSPVIIEATVKRNSVDSFLKIEFQIPGTPPWKTEGLESGGGIYMRTETTVAYRWLRIPLDKDEFKVKFRVLPPKDYVGKFMIPGTYYFIRNEERQNNTIEAKEITVTENNL
jgi:hypothetical protein